MSSYSMVKNKLARGWNTWNTRSVLSHVLLPEAFAINLGIKEYKEGSYLKEALIGRFNELESSVYKDNTVEVIHPGPHAYDGSYTELNIKWRGIEAIVQTAVLDDELVVLVTPLVNQKYPATLVVETGILWNRKGHLRHDDDCIIGVFDDREVRVYITKENIYDPNIAVQTPFFSVVLNEPIGISTGRKRSIEEIRSIIEENRIKHSNSKMKYGDLAEAYSAMQSVMAWDTIYEPKNDMVVTTVSRLWNVSAGGYILACWDNYFAAYLAALDNRELAYSNAIEITRTITKDGFIPNIVWGSGLKSLDRSEPPVGSMVVRELYRRYKDKWLLEMLFNDLYTWNTWYVENRGLRDGTLALGSTPYAPIYDNYWETAGVGATLGGALEAGLDNSPMYDDIPFNSERNTMELSDVGLTSLIIMDCNALSDIADILGKKKEANILTERAKRISSGLTTLWDEKTGIFLNKRTDTGEFSHRISPNNFYPLLTDVITNDQVDRMLEHHFYNPEEFWGEWIMPSIARNDPAYKDQSYWRGRIWAPMNFLVYLGLRCHDTPLCKKARRDMAEKSIKLLQKEWLQFGHVHENYNGDTGEGCDVPNSDKFYFWGGLLSSIALLEKGYLDGPENPIIR